MLASLRIVPSGVAALDWSPRVSGSFWPEWLLPGSVQTCFVEILSGVMKWVGGIAMLLGFLVGRFLVEL